MKRAYRVEWRSHGIYPTTQRVVAGDAREAAQWAPQHNIEATGVMVEASGERVPDELWRSGPPPPGPHVVVVKCKHDLPIASDASSRRPTDHRTLRRS